MATGQDAVNTIRQYLGETDPTNSRWTDEQLFLYYQKARKKFARQSEAVKVEFERTTLVGATPGNVYARYQLDPRVYKIDYVYWDNNPLFPAQDDTAWRSRFDPADAAIEGTPFMFRRYGDALDLYHAPEKAATLLVGSSIIPDDLATIDSPEQDLKADHIEAASHWAAYKALSDDDRDGSEELVEYRQMVNDYRKQQNRRGPRFVQEQDGKSHRRDIHNA